MTHIIIYLVWFGHSHLQHDAQKGGAAHTSCVFQVIIERAGDWKASSTNRRNRILIWFIKLFVVIFALQCSPCRASIIFFLHSTCLLHPIMWRGTRSFHCLTACESLQPKVMSFVLLYTDTLFFLRKKVVKVEACGCSFSFKKWEVVVIFSFFGQKVWQRVIANAHTKCASFLP